MRRITTAILFILISELAGIIGSIFTFASINDWYSYLNKPFFNPPNFIFGPVWTFLYALMGVAAFFVWEKRKKTKVSKALIYFTLQLILNSIWSIIFFGLKNPLFAFFEIIILWLLILKTTLEFYKISKITGYLFIPYIAWVTFASILNLSIVFLN